MKTAKFEGYYDDARDAFDALEKKLHHDLASELDKYRETIQEMLELDIISAYYYQRGSIAAGLGYDKQLKEAVRLLRSPEEYQRILHPGKKNNRRQTALQLTAIALFFKGDCLFLFCLIMRFNFFRGIYSWPFSL